MELRDLKKKISSPALGPNEEIVAAGSLENWGRDFLSCGFAKHALLNFLLRAGSVA